MKFLATLDNGQTTEINLDELQVMHSDEDVQAMLDRDIKEIEDAKAAYWAVNK